MPNELEVEGSNPGIAITFLGRQCSNKNELIRELISRIFGEMGDMHSSPNSLEWTDGISSQQRNFPYSTLCIVVVCSVKASFEELESEWTDGKTDPNWRYSHTSEMKPSMHSQVVNEEGGLCPKNL